MEFSQFKYKTADIRKLVKYGFVKNGAEYVYNTQIVDGQFNMTVTVSAGGDVTATVVDLATDEPYTLHLVAEACGAFVGQVRTEFDGVLEDIANECFYSDVFKDDISHELIAYVREKYGDELEFLWEKFTDNAVWRRKDNNKWYGALLTVKKCKLGSMGSPQTPQFVGVNSDENVTVIDFRIDPDTDSGVVDGKKYFAGYHMNKRTWMTIILDGSVPVDEIKEWIDKSYTLANKK